MNIEKKLFDLRKLMFKQKLDIYLIPYTDEFHNEFLPPYSQRLEWLSGFTGSAGDIIVLQKKAYIFVDGRYTIQVSKEVNKDNFTVINYKDQSVAQLIHKLTTSKSTVGFDGNIETFQKIESYKKLVGKKINFISVEKNLIDQVWKTKKSKKRSVAFFHPAKFNGQNSEEKIKKIIRNIQKNNADSYYLNSSETICWLFNLRANDLEYSPLLLSKSVVQKNGTCYIFTDAKNLKNKTLTKKIKFFFQPLREFRNFISNNEQKNKKYVCSPNEISYNEVIDINKNSGKLIFKENIVNQLKSIKNPTEINGMKKSHIRDGVSLTRFIFWIKKNISKKEITELVASKKINNLRSLNQNFFSLSFPTIAGSGPNAAIVHYRATKKTNRKINDTDLFLLDSGAQYLDGTTDVTRTISFKSVTNEQIKMYTLVLKGHIAVAFSQFNKYENGQLLDKKARQFLLKYKKNFEHGTGHGVGSFLNVHEGPHSISPRSKCRFEEGMIVSNEPGFYKKNHYGIRIENLILTKKIKSTFSFDTITMAPLEPMLIDEKLLTLKEKDWINSYHREVFSNISPHLNKNEFKWLKDEINSLKY